MKEGMTISNGACRSCDWSIESDADLRSTEPGYYKDGSFGIRIEDVLVVKQAATPHNFADRGYLAFENFTLCPIQTKMVDVGLLTKFERDWLNDYHARGAFSVNRCLPQEG